MSVPFKLSEELIKWKDKYGEKTPTKKDGRIYDKIDHKIRRDLILILVEHLKSLGAEKQFIYISKEKIAKSCNPPRESVPLKSWRDRMRGTFEDLDWAIVKVYGTDSEPHKAGKKVEKYEKQGESLEDSILREDDEANAQEMAQIAADAKPIERKEFDPSKYKSEEPVLKDAPDPDWDEELGWVK